MATKEVRQAGPVFHPALGIRISQRFSDVQKVGWSCSPTERHWLVGKQNSPESWGEAGELQWEFWGERVGGEDGGLQQTHGNGVKCDANLNELV